jgi:hypothetical protein
VLGARHHEEGENVTRTLGITKNAGISGRENTGMVFIQRRHISRKRTPLQYKSTESRNAPTKFGFQGRFM